MDWIWTPFWDHFGTSWRPWGSSGLLGERLEVSLDPLGYSWWPLGLAWEPLGARMVDLTSKPSLPLYPFAVFSRKPRSLSIRLLRFIQKTHDVSIRLHGFLAPNTTFSTPFETLLHSLSDCIFSIKLCNPLESEARSTTEHALPLRRRRRTVTPV